MRIRIDGRGRWMTCAVTRVRMPWEVWLTGLRWAIRNRRRRLARPTEYDYDERTMTFTESGRSRFVRIANAVLAMAEMQKFIG